MAKGKGQPGVQNRHIYTRASYLYQAAAYLATASLQTQGASSPNHHATGAPTSSTKETKGSTGDGPDPASSAGDDQRRALRNMSRHLLADMRAVSLKVLIRQRPEVKRSVCRRCDALLIEGGSCDAFVENPSRGGRKPWADVLVVRCRTCGGAKRFPVGEPGKRQLRKGLRGREETVKGEMVEGKAEEQV